MLVFAASFSKAQQVELVANQNPNYQSSVEKYRKLAEASPVTMSTTIQETYKAYDWTTAKQEQKQQRIAFRQQRSLARINNRYSNVDYFFWRPRYYYYR
jgi:hypothetical protein